MRSEERVAGWGMGQADGPHFHQVLVVKLLDKTVVQTARSWNTVLEEGAISIVVEPTQNSPATTMIKDLFSKFIAGREPTAL
jgi:hypothetical protein